MYRKYEYPGKLLRLDFETNMIKATTNTDKPDSQGKMDTTQSTHTASKQQDTTQWWFSNEGYITDDEVVTNNEAIKTKKVEFQSNNLLQKVRDPEYDFTSDWESIINANANNH